MREDHRVGLDYLRTVTELLQRVRKAHPTFGLYQAAEIQFWWSVARSTDTFDQLFWFDDQDRPVAAVTVTDFADGTSLVYEQPTMVVIVMPDATSEWVAHVVGRGLAHLDERGIHAVELEVDSADGFMRDLLLGHGFTRRGPAVVECWLDADRRPDVSPLAGGYRLQSRLDRMDRPHHLSGSRRADPERRLRQTSLYRPELDLVVVDADENPVAHGMFWYDPATGTGVVEPMRTSDAHQRRGLGRHILTSGVDRLADAGATRISIGFEPDNPSSGHLYRSVGFEPHRRTDSWARGG